MNITERLIVWLEWNKRPCEERDLLNDALEELEQAREQLKAVSDGVNRRCGYDNNQLPLVSVDRLNARLAEAEAERDLESSDRVSAEFEMLALRDRLSESEAEIKRLNQVLNNSLAGIEDAYSGGSEQAAKGGRDEKS